MAEQARTLGFGETFDMAAMENAGGRLLTLTSHRGHDEHPPHKHSNDYLWIVLAGGFAELERNRWRDRPSGSVFAHSAGETHHDHIGPRGAICLNLHFAPGETPPAGIEGACSIATKITADRLAFELAAGFRDELALATLAAEIMAQVTAEARKERSGYGVLGTALASAMVGPMVDSLVTPAGMRAAFAANRNRPQGAPKPKQPGASAFDVSDEVEIERRGLSEFTVRNSKRSEGVMVFRRHGLGWKLSGVDLPQAQVPQT